MSWYTSAVQEKHFQKVPLRFQGVKSFPQYIYIPKEIAQISLSTNYLFHLGYETMLWLISFT